MSCRNITAIHAVPLPASLPREPHKYESKAAQDANLDMLIGWIRDYTERQDVFSYHAHRDFYERFAGEKLMYTDNVQRNVPQR